MQTFMTDKDVVARVLGHIADGTTDRGDDVWQEPVENYRSEARFKQELALIRSVPMPFCPSTALPKAGDYIARNAAHTPLIVVRGKDGTVRAFKNACRHRGTQLVEGKGCAGAFVCPYHGWSYGLDGALLGIPHEDGFPDFDKLANGLSKVTAIETNGIIFIVQQDPNETQSEAQAMLSGLPEILKDDQIIFSESEMIVEANWKLHLESFLEGYHIKPAHKKTFYPFGYDNLNIIEFCGPHARVTFPFRRIETLKGTADKDLEVSDKLTYVTHMFPNVILAELTYHYTLGILEPLNVSKTKITTYNLTKSTDAAGKDKALADAKRDIAFVNETGQTEDIAMVTGIQRSLHSKANETFTFGHFEPAIVHFHKEMAKRLRRS
ncbi:aromatic ring-hydroxylating oxygenase subunit alpha [Hellea balneolensis]|uniref:aromatic ring-hydroxylating oxygenase subunit alpha n=1 Tax=Hellea balneolensis TaxID=287478 RepID=UPI0004048D6D|nr:aromatic ring-hydroxylating dioxygenase subunit alpha [Hellea balneolensis]